MLQNLMRNSRDRYHSVWWCSLVRFTIYFSSVVVLSCRREVSHTTSLSHKLFITSRVTFINYAFMTFRLVQRRSDNTSQVCVDVFSSFSSSYYYSRYGVPSVHFIPIGAFWHILPVLFFCHCIYHPHRSICEAQ